MRLSYRIVLNGIKNFFKSQWTYNDFVKLCWAYVDAIWLEVVRFMPDGDKTIKEGPYGEYMIINWDRKIVTLGDPTGVSTWRFSLDEYNHLVLRRGSVKWNPDYNLSCWRLLEKDLKDTIDNKVNQILLEE